MSVTPPRAGRPRDPQVAAAIETAALELVAEHGFHAVTIERIAAAAGVGRPTVYRRWTDKADLVVDAVRHRVSARVDPPDQGSLRADLLAVLRGASSEFARDVRLTIGVASALPHHPELAAAVREYGTELARHQAGTVIGRAIGRGELPADTPVDDFVFRVAESLLLGQAIRGTDRVDDDFLVRVVDDLMLPALHRGIRPTGPDNGAKQSGNG